MWSSIARLAAITAVVLFLTFLAVVFVRWMGEHQRFEVPPHPWFADKTWTIWSPPGDVLCKLPEVSPEVIVLVPVRKSGDTWQVPCAGTPPPLADFLKQMKGSRILLNVEATDTPDLDKLVDIVSPFDDRLQVAINAPAQKVARYLRQKAPQWLYAADSASLLRLHVFDSLFLEPALDFWPDFVIASTNLSDGTRLNPHEADELHRRKKRILWNESSATQAPFPVDGILTERGPGLRNP